jgi:hypothetical protein
MDGNLVENLEWIVKKVWKFRILTLLDKVDYRKIT